ncbi:hypothetical protein U6Q21_12645, partial [Cutibacterium acnes]
METVSRLPLLQNDSAVGILGFLQVGNEGRPILGIQVANDRVSPQVFPIRMYLGSMICLPQPILTAFEDGAQAHSLRLPSMIAFIIKGEYVKKMSIPCQHR